MSDITAKKVLRIVLDIEATKAFEAMVASLKAETPTVKISLSQFVSFLVADFFEAHFEKDKAVLIAGFFDSDAYFDTARKKAKGSADYEEKMAAALSDAQKIRSKRRNKMHGANKPHAKSKEAVIP